MEPYQGLEPLPERDTVAYARELRTLYRAAEQRAVRFRLLVEMSRDLVNVRDTDALLHLALVRVTTFSGYDTGAILLLAADGNLTTRAALHINDHAQPVVLAPAVLQAAQQALHAGAIMQSPSTIDAAVHAPAPAQIYLPLIANDGTLLGVLVLLDATLSSAPDADDLDALQLLTAQLAAALQNTQLYEARNQLVAQLTEREARLAEMLERLMRAQEEERRRVAYEIHDGLAQMMLGVLLQLRTLNDRFKPRAPAARQALERAVTMAQATVEEARTIIAGLRPTVLDDMGLAQALHFLVRSLEADGWPVTYVEALGDERLPTIMETALYRIAQEALNNVRKHAGPTPVAVTVQRDQFTVKLTIQDWGRGFDYGGAELAAKPGTQVGLASIGERVSLLQGRWHLVSNPGQGTRSEVVLPLRSRHNPEGDPINGETAHGDAAALSADYC